MKLRTLAKIILPAALLQQAGWAFAAGGPSALVPCSVYGQDDRVDLYQADQIMKKLAGSTAALFEDSDLSLDAASGQYKLTPVSLKEQYNLKDGQRFNEQPTGAFCSAALVGEDLVLTAGHCFKPYPKSAPCESVKFVFGYAVTAAGVTPASFPADNVYSCKAVLAQRVQDDKSNFMCSSGRCVRRRLAGFGPDFALVRLDRKVKGRYPLAVSRTKVTAGTKVAVIGYPSGLPVKVAGNAKVRSVTNKGYFVTDLDTFGGNSGSPVFNMATYKIEGVLVRGAADYVYSSGGTPVEDPDDADLQQPGETRVYPQEDGKGEDVTLSTVFERMIPKTAMESALDNQAPDTAPRNPGIVPAIYVPGTGGTIQPAIYSPPPSSGPAIMEI
ncbi:MAG: trypsin-like peptidase domain-containing protein [Elusimicrobia bacterium]|nr:trypsin-like peptidase domain-containing protein [Elusimicrobiota bacterium]